MLILGVDGADWNVINDLVKQGRLPNFKKIIDGGTRAELETIEPILSPIIWTTIATAKDPEKHGITWFMVNDPKTGQGIPITSLNREVRAIWNMASERGKSAGVVGWWATWPAEKINGFVITDHMAFHGFGLGTGQHSDKGEPGRTYPEELADELAPMVPSPLTIPKSRIDPFMKITDQEYEVSVGKAFEFSNPLHHFMFMLATMDGYEKMSLPLYEKRRPDLMAVYFEAVDTTSHLYMKYRAPKLPGISDAFYAKYNDTVNKVYEKQDRILGEFLKRMDEDTTLIVCSDHGFKTGEDRLAEVMNTSVATAHLWHRKYGVLILYGKKIRRGHVLGEAHVADVGATALYLMGLPVALDFDGKVLLDAVEEKYLAAHPATMIKTYETSPMQRPEIKASGDTNKALREKLQSLGYLSAGGSKNDRPADKPDAAFGSIEAGLNRINAFVEKGELDRALDEADATAGKNPEDFRPHMTKTGILLLQKQWEPALAAQDRALYLFDDTLKKYPADISEPKLPAQYRDAGVTHGIMYLNLGMCEMNLGRTNRAIGNFEKAAKYDPNSPAPLYNLALIAEQKGDIAGAASLYEKNLTRFPNHPLSHNNLGNALVRLGKSGEAKKHYEVTARLDPNHVESRHNLGVLLQNENNSAGAKKAFEQAIRINPEFAPSLLALVEISANEKNFEQARKNLGVALRVDSKNPICWVTAVRLELSAGNPAEALRYLEVLRAVDPNLATKLVAAYPALKTSAP